MFRRNAACIPVIARVLSRRRRSAVSTILDVSKRRLELLHLQLQFDLISEVGAAVFRLISFTHICETD